MAEEKKDLTEVEKDEVNAQWRQIKKTLKLKSKSELAIMLFQAHIALEHYKKLYTDLVEQLKNKASEKGESK